MSEENAAQAEEIQEETLESVEAIEAESAPAETQETEKEDGFQKRINKVTADKYAEKRRADELEKRLKELEAEKASAPTKQPALEDFDHDEDKYNEALIEYKVEQVIKAQEDKRRAEAARAESGTIEQSFNERIVALGKSDFAEKANAVPTLPDGVADALIQSEIGPELIYYLGEHLDQADKIASMSPAQAMLELGRITAKMDAKPEIKTSAAPDPIQPLNSGGSISKERGPAGATFE